MCTQEFEQVLTEKLEFRHSSNVFYINKHKRTVIWIYFTCKINFLLILKHLNVQNHYKNIPKNKLKIVTWDLKSKTYLLKTDNNISNTFPT